MRYVVYGPGAVGGTIAARLAQHGREVAVIARGAHLEAISRDGLRLDDPDASYTATVPAFADPEQVEWRGDEAVILTVKTQDTAAALRALTAAAPESVAVVCAQNGVENERLATRCFDRVYGICVMLPATHLEPGVVQAHSSPVSGILDIGRVPDGVDHASTEMAADLRHAGFESRPEERIMRWKYAKLLMNLGNALEAACGTAARRSPLYAAARAEGVAALTAAGIPFASEEEDRERRADHLVVRPVGGARRGGGSSWQSLARGTGAIETDYLNGEVVLLGRLHGLPTPVNALLQRTANAMARTGAAPGSIEIADLESAM